MQVVDKINHSLSVGGLISEILARENIQKIVSEVEGENWDIDSLIGLITVLVDYMWKGICQRTGVIRYEEDIYDGSIFEMRILVIF